MRMERKDLIMLLIAFIIGAVVISVCCFLLPEKPSLTQFFGRTTVKEIVPPPATGNIDDIIDALLKEISDEASLFIQEEYDTVLITNDAQEIDDFGQSIDESEL